MELWVQHMIVHTRMMEEVYGARATINMWDPSIQVVNEVSLYQVLILSGSYDGTDLNSIEARCIIGFFFSFILFHFPRSFGFILSVCLSLSLGPLYMCLSLGLEVCARLGGLLLQVDKSSSFGCVILARPSSFLVEPPKNKQPIKSPNICAPSSTNNGSC